MGREEEVNVERQFIHFGPSLMSFRMVLQKRKKKKKKKKKKKRERNPCLSKISFTLANTFIFM